MKIKISVCIATYNGEKFISEQLDSILRQLSSNDEVIISDDSSTDRTPEILEAYSKSDTRIRIFLNQKFRNPVLNFQNALVKTTGEFIFLSDQDDIWIENKVSESLKILEHFDLVLHDSIVTDNSLKPIIPSFFLHFGSRKGIIKNILRSSYYGSCMAFRRRVLEASLPFPSTIEIGHDLWLGLVSELYFKVFFLDKAFILYRKHSQAFTIQNSKRPFHKKIFGRVIIAYFLLKFIYKKSQSLLRKYFFAPTIE